MNHENDCRDRFSFPCCKISRRHMLAGAGAVAAAALGYPLLRRYFLARTPVFLARNQRYDGPLAETIAAGLEAVGFDRDWVRGRKVLLKPNLVEPTLAAPQISTNPNVVLAAAEVFRRWGAEVAVGEGPGHVRDTEMALVESGMNAVLRDEKLRFVDFNYSEFRDVRNAGGLSALESFTFPAAVLDADLIVSMPKLKTHHWMGLTAAMKNLYGTLPGLVYGWPKNVLHYAGIPQTVVDINASLPRTIAIVDGILCMEGDGPILGTPKADGPAGHRAEPHGRGRHAGPHHGLRSAQGPLFGVGRGPPRADLHLGNRRSRRALARVGQSILLRRRAAFAGNADGAESLRLRRSVPAECAGVQARNMLCFL